MFNLFIFLIALAGFLSLINYKFIKFPQTIGVMFLSLILSVGLLIYVNIDQSSDHRLYSVLMNIDFRTILFDFLLGILLFAGAIHINLSDLLKEKSSVITYATVGVVVSTLLIGSGFFLISGWIGIDISWPYCLVFGALISPTDPVAVLALLQKAGAPKDLEIKVVGESLFNDGVGIVVFLSLLAIATMVEDFSFIHIAEDFLIEAGGGLLIGIVLGFLGLVLVNRVDKEPIIGVHLTLAIVLAGYSISNWLHVSGAIAMVVAGLVLGNGLSKRSTSDSLKHHLHIFWKVLDEIFNVVLFLLIGLEIIQLEFEWKVLLLGLITIPLMIIVRFATLFIAEVFNAKQKRSSLKEKYILTWAGLRGGISIALVLTLPEGEIRESLLLVTYILVVFSIMVQGLTIEKLVRRLL